MSATSEPTIAAVAPGRSAPAERSMSAGGRPSLAFIAWLGLRLLMKRAQFTVACWLAGTTVAEVRRLARLRALVGDGHE